jgi:class 3 adenylate cyclase
VLDRFGEVTTELTQRFGGTVVKSTGDGYLSTFDGPTQAIRCAEALRADAETSGIEIRAGIHTGECELLDASRSDPGKCRPLARRVGATASADTDAGSLKTHHRVAVLVLGLNNPAGYHTPGGAVI